jgi:PncC family amidohydrolase
LINTEKHPFHGKGALLTRLPPSFEIEESMEKNQNLFEELRREMIGSNLTLSVAESCTGGLIAHRITEIPGASDYFDLGIVAYSNDAKMNLLGVREASLIEFGAVSETVAREMALGVAAVSGSQCAISVTGIAGPGGGSPDKPVGTVYIGVFHSGLKTCHVERHNFSGSRSEIKEKIAVTAVQSLRSFLSSRK